MPLVKGGLVENFRIGNPAACWHESADGISRFLQIRRDLSGGEMLCVFQTHRNIPGVARHGQLGIPVKIKITFCDSKVSVVGQTPEISLRCAAISLKKSAAVEGIIFIVLLHTHGGAHIQKRLKHDRPPAFFNQTFFFSEKTFDRPRRCEKVSCVLE